MSDIAFALHTIPFFTGYLAITLSDVSAYKVLRVHDYEVSHTVFFAPNCQFAPLQEGKISTSRKLNALCNILAKVEDDKAW